MALFNRNEEENRVPEIRVQGEEAMVPQTEEDGEDKEKKIKFSKKVWGCR